MTSVKDRPRTRRPSAAAVGRRPLPPLESHAGWDGEAFDRDPVATLLGQEETRVPELIAVRHERMGVSPFTFFRGAAAVMAADLANTPTTDLRVQLCGDAHLSNFGGYQSPEREMVFDINDFDETLPGPFEWDVKRLAASMVIAGRDRFKPKECRQAALSASRSYREAMLDFAQLGELAVWYSRLDTSSVMQKWQRLAGSKAAKAFRRNVAKARRKDSSRAYQRLVHEVGNRITFVSDPPLIVPSAEFGSDQQQQEARSFLDRVVTAYRKTLSHDRAKLLERFELVDVARKVVGVGSVGTRCWMGLFLGRSRSDPLILQCKEAQASVLEPYAGPCEYANSGQRVVEGQRYMQAASDIFLGWVRFRALQDGIQRDYYIRQLWDGKISAEVEAFTPQLLSIYGEMCGWTLARAHARSGHRVAIASYLGGTPAFEESLADFAEAYALQNERDYAAFTGATLLRPDAEHNSSGKVKRRGRNQ